METALLLVELKLGLPACDIEPVVQEHLKHFLERQRLGLALNQRNRIDAKRFFQGSVPVQQIQHLVRVKTRLDVNDETQSVVSVCEVRDVGDPF